MRVLSCLCTVALVTAVGLGAAPSDPADIRLGTPGRAAATPFITTTGDTVLVVWSASVDGTTDLYAARSTDGGRTFATPVRVNDQDDDVDVSGEQPPRVVFTPRASGDGRDGAAVLWISRTDGKSRIRLAQSTDGGRSFSPAVTVHATELSGIRGWSSLAALPDGTLNAVWLDGRNADVPSAEAATRDEGETHQGHGQAGGTPARTAPRQDVYSARYAPDGRIVEQSLASDVCFCCKTAVATAKDGSVYAAWRHIYPGSIRDIAVSRASREGTFGEPVRVSEDNWELQGCPDDGPAIVVDGASRLHIAWPTLVDGPEPEIGLFHAVATPDLDFAPRQRIQALGGIDASHPQMTMAGPDGLAVVWDEIVDKIRRIAISRSTAIDSTSGAVQFGEPTIISGDENGSYPVAAPVRDGVIVAWTSGQPESSVIAVRRLTSSK